MTRFPAALKSWRSARRYSQLDLAGIADISARHLSFLETGRARPSRDMVLRLGRALALPMAAQNQMLGDAGFAPHFASRDWTDADMAPIRQAVDHMLETHAPYPALALDRLWTIQQMNPPARALYGMLGVASGDSLLDLLVSSALPQVIENWPELAARTAHRLRLESLAAGHIAAFDPVIAHLEAAGSAAALARHPVIPTVLRMDDLRLSLFATLSQFGTPEDVTLEDIKIELYFPLDAATKAYFHAT
ncbi:MAG: helix-turn-helix domain-containing protein [Pseudomonadota bacterium]